MGKFLLVGLLAGASLATPAMAMLKPFATFAPLTSTPNIRFVSASGTFQTGTASQYSVPVSFNLLDPALGAVGPLDASFVLSAQSSSPSQAMTDLVAQNGFSGSFAFTYSGAASIFVNGQSYGGGGAAVNLLSATFDNASLYGSAGGTTANFAGSTGAGDHITFSSDLIDLSASRQRDFSLTLVSLLPTLQQNANGKIGNFRGTAIGEFSTGAVPEPSAWVLMMAGFGLIGCATRAGRRRSPSPSLPLVHY